MEDEKEKDRSNFTDILKRVVSSGVSAAFMTEDAVKDLLGGLPLPKEIINGLLQNAKVTRNEFISSVKNELKSYLDRVDVSKEVDRVLDNYDLEINAKIKFKKKASSKKS